MLYKKTHTQQNTHKKTPCNPGMCLHQESNWQPFGVLDEKLQPTELLWPGSKQYFKNEIDTLG